MTEKQNFNPYSIVDLCSMNIPFKQRGEQIIKSKKNNKLRKILFRGVGFFQVCFILCGLSFKMSAQRTFNHLGATENNEELTFVKQKILAKEEPWNGEFNELLTWAVAGNLANVGSGENGPRDLCKNAYANALAWHYTGNVIYANRSIAILNAWANNFKGYSTTAGQDLLVGGWIGTLLGPTAELMRNFSAWSAADQTKMKEMFVARFYPVINTMSTWNGNVDLTQIQAMLAIAVFNEDETEFNAGIERLKKRNPAYFYLSTDLPASRNYGGSTSASWGSGSAVTGWVDGLTQETCRDNGHHAQFAMAAALSAAEIAWHQGVDVYAQEQKRYVAVLELMAKQLTSGNMQGTCANNVTNPDRYNTFEIGYNHYHNRLGLDLPETEKILPISRASESSWNIFFETLTHRGTGHFSSPCSKPNLGENQSICGKSLITLNTNISESNKTIVWFKDDLILQNQSGSSLEISQAGKYRVDVDSVACKTSDEIVISGILELDLGADKEICATTSLVLNAGNKNGNDVTYKWNNGAETQTILVYKSGIYSVTVSALGCKSVSDQVQVSSKLLEVNTDTLCSAGEIKLFVNATSGTYNWYEYASNGEILATGLNYTPTIIASKTYYLEDANSTSGSLGKTNVGVGTVWGVTPDQFSDADKQYKVNVLKTVNLNSIVVYVRSSGNVTINFKQGAATIHSKTFTGLAIGRQVLNLGFGLEAGDYVLDGIGSTAELGYESVTSGATFPYSYPGFISFSNNTTWQSAWYGMFYDWEISVGNVCARTPVYAVIDEGNPNCLTGLFDSKSSQLFIYPNPINNQITIAADQNLVGDIQIFNAFGDLVHYQNLNGMSDSQTINLSYLNNGIYFITIGEKIQKFVVEK